MIPPSQRSRICLLAPLPLLRLFATKAIIESNKNQHMANRSDYLILQDKLPDRFFRLFCRFPNAKSCDSFTWESREYIGEMEVSYEIALCTN